MRSTTTLVFLAASGMALAFATGLGLPPLKNDKVLSPALAQITCTPPARAFARLELLFGTARKDGAFVSEADWLAFLSDEVTPRFPDGLTVLTGLGQWRTTHGQITRETSRVLLIWHVPGPQTEVSISGIQNSYRQRYQQDSVMRVDSVSCVAF